MSQSVTEKQAPPHARYAKRPRAAVFYPASAIILLALLVTTFFPEQFKDFIEDGNTVVVNSIGWY